MNLKQLSYTMKPQVVRVQPTREINVKAMFDAQKELDDKYMERIGATQYPRQEYVTAYRVELGEMLNEWQQFKIWKMNKQVSRKNMLIEFADCLKLAISIAAHDEFYTMHRWTHLFNGKDIYIQKMTVYDLINECFEVRADNLEMLIKLGVMLGFTLDEIDRAFWYKHKITLERFEQGY